MFLYSLQYMDGAGILQIKQIIADSAKHAKDKINLKPAETIIKDKMQYIGEEKIYWYNIILENWIICIEHTNITDVKLLFEYFYPGKHNIMDVLAYE